MVAVEKEIRRSAPGKGNDAELQQKLEAAARGESFRDHAARVGPAVAEQVRREAIESSAAESAQGQEDKAASDALMLDALDELQMAEELRGRVISQYFYEFDNKGRTITGISWAGVKAIARHMALRGEGVTISEVTFSEGEDGDAPWIGCLVRSKDMRTGEERFAWASQSTIMKLRDGGRMPDPFAKTKALNKAQRNALRQFIPEVVVLEMFKAWKEGAALPVAAKRAVDKSLTQGASS